MSATTHYQHISRDGVSVVLAQTGDQLPRIVHWGRELESVEPELLAQLDRANTVVAGSDTLDDEVRLTVVPTAADGWAGMPGTVLHRAGGGFSPRWTVTNTTEYERDNDSVLQWVAVDDALGAALTVDLELSAAGILRLRATVHNRAEAGTEALEVQAVAPVVPLPVWADEVMEHAGRHLLERQEHRTAFPVGIHMRENRKGRGHDATLLLAAGERGFGYRRGEVWAAHVAWSGYTRAWVERVQPAGFRVLGGGELVNPGEIRLLPGEEYSSPWLWCSYGDGLDELASRFHTHLRSRPEHPTTPRKVMVNSWEAVYFDHDRGRLDAIVAQAADIGAERFVLDDGWFRGRRHSRAGLGDWEVDREVWPDGLAPFIATVNQHGMDFGIWVEPEMVNLDSDVARAHPEWIMQPHGGRLPSPSRSQHVLNLAHPDAWDHVWHQLDALLRDHDIAYVKWDHNRDVVEAGDSRTGTAAVHAQTLAAYRLWDALRAAHPTVEFESCSGGGGRADLGIMQRADRVWASDTIDALERVQIDEATGLLLPPEMIGAHIGAPRAHTTGRTHALGFRATTAIFGHLGVEWDLTTMSAHDREELTGWVALYRELRSLLHHGRVVHADTGDRDVRIRGVVSPSQQEAVFSVVQRGSALSYPFGRVRLPGLSARRSYRVSLRAPGDAIGPIKPTPSGWWTRPLVLTGEMLEHVGLAAPPQLPESALLIHVVAVDGAAVDANTR